MTVLKVAAAANKDDADVHELQLKKEMEELAIVCAKQRLDKRIVFEREKEEIKKRQMEAKASALEASKQAKVDLKLKEAKEKAEAFNKKCESAYFHTNSVSLLSIFGYFLHVIYSVMPNMLKRRLFFCRFVRIMLRVVNMDHLDHPSIMVHPSHLFCQPQC